MARLSDEVSCDDGGAIRHTSRLYARKTRPRSHDTGRTERRLSRRERREYRDDEQNKRQGQAGSDVQHDAEPEAGDSV